MNRVFKQFVVQLVSISTLKSKHVTGKIRWKIVSSRTKSVKWNRCCTPMSHCVKMVSWPAEMATVSNAVYSVTVKRIVLMVPMKTVAVSIFFPNTNSISILLSRTRWTSRSISHIHLKATLSRIDFYISEIVKVKVGVNRQKKLFYDWVNEAFGIYDTKYILSISCCVYKYRK